jgi:SPP1 family predicted phage head-tail adaptor
MMVANLRLIHERLAKDENAQDTSEESASWITAGPSVFAELIPVGDGGEVFSQSQIKALVQVRFRIRYTSRIRALDRLRATDGRIWHVEAVQPQNQKRKYIIVRATEWQLSRT